MLERKKEMMVRSWIEEEKERLLERAYDAEEPFLGSFYAQCIESTAADAHEIFALLPYRITDVKTKVRRQGDEFQIEAQVVPDKGKNGIHTLRFELSDPAGQVRSEYSNWVRTVQGRGGWKWHVPLNAPGGKWNLKVTETVSGISRKIELDVLR